MSNWLFRSAMPKLSSNGWKLLCFIYSETLGFRQESRKISYDGMCSGTGIKGRATVSQCIKELTDAGYLLTSQTSHSRHAITYRLNTEFQTNDAKKAEPIKPHIDNPIQSGSAEIELPTTFCSSKTELRQSLGRPEIELSDTAKLATENDSVVQKLNYGSSEIELQSGFGSSKIEHHERHEEKDKTKDIFSHAKPEQEKPKKPRQKKVSTKPPANPNHVRLMKYIHERIGPMSAPIMEGASVKWILDNGYTPEQAIACLEEQLATWTFGTITWASVRKNIGTFVARCNAHTKNAGMNGNGKAKSAYATKAEQQLDGFKNLYAAEFNNPPIDNSLVIDVKPVGASTNGRDDAHDHRFLGGSS